MRDKQMLDAALAYEKQVADFEQSEREAAKKEVIELQKFHMKTQADRSAQEKLVEQMIADENAKQWNAREAQWRREDQARINLLKNVY